MWSWSSSCIMLIQFKVVPHWALLKINFQGQNYLPLFSYFLIITWSSAPRYSLSEINANRQCSFIEGRKKSRYLEQQLDTSQTVLQLVWWKSYSKRQRSRVRVTYHRLVAFTVSNCQIRYSKIQEVCFLSSPAQTNSAWHF